MTLMVFWVLKKIYTEVYSVDVGIDNNDDVLMTG